MRSVPNYHNFNFNPTKSLESRSFWGLCPLDPLTHLGPQGGPQTPYLKLAPLYALSSNPGSAPDLFMHDKSILKLSIQLLFVKHKVNQFYKNQNPLSICHSTIMQLKITYQTRDEQTLISVALSSRPKKKILMKLSKSKVFTTTVWYLTYGLIIFVYLRFPGLPWVIS